MSIVILAVIPLSIHYVGVDGRREFVKSKRTRICRFGGEGRRSRCLKRVDVRHTLPSALSRACGTRRADRSSWRCWVVELIVESVRRVERLGKYSRWMGQCELSRLLRHEGSSAYKTARHSQLTFARQTKVPMFPTPGAAACSSLFVPSAPREVDRRPCRHPRPLCALLLSIHCEREPFPRCNLRAYHPYPRVSSALYIVHAKKYRSCALRRSPRPVPT